MYFGSAVLQCTHIILDHQNGKARDCPFPHASKQMHTNKRTVQGHREPQTQRERESVPECSHLPPPVRPFLSEKDERSHLGGAGAGTKRSHILSSIHTCEKGRCKGPGSFPLLS